MQPGRRRHSPDYLLTAVMILLLGLGLIIIYSISPVLSHKLLGDVSDNHFLYGQLLHVGLAVTAFAVTSNIHYGRWRKLVPALLVGAALSVLLLMIPALAVTKNGATRWVDLGPLTFQPAEVIKFTLIFLLADQFSNLRTAEIGEQKRRFKLALICFGVTALLVLFLQKDMGTMIVISAIIAGIYWLSGASAKYIGLLSATGLGTGIASIILFPHRIARFLTYFNSSENVSGAGYHLNQALIAIGSGGFWGLGIGKSIQVYGYLPEAANDSIFAIVGETFGFIGSVVILSMFAWLLYRGIKVGLSAPDRFSQLLVLGIMLWLGSQAVINIAAMIGLVPLTGIPLPFLSYGGTSLVTSTAALGIVANVSKYTKRGVYAESRSLGRGNRRPSDANPHYRPSFKG